MSDDRNPDGYQPSPEELKARNRRNIAIALLLLAFMVFVFITIIVRGSSAGG